MKKFILYVLVIALISNTNAQEWNKVGNGLLAGSVDITDSEVFAMKEWKGKLYIGGPFRLTDIPVGSLQKIAMWNNQIWDTLPLCIKWGAPYSFGIFNDELYVGGKFGCFGPAEQYMTCNPEIFPGNIPNTARIIRWDGSNWSSVGLGFTTTTGPVYVMQYKEDLYVGGAIGQIGNLIVRRIARWDGENWYGVGGGFSGDHSEIKGMAIFNDELHAAGTFTNAGGKSIFNIARWDGVQWNDLDTGLMGYVNALAVDTINNLLYVAGYVWHVGGIGGINIINCIAKWDGYCWSPVGDSLVSPTDFSSLTMYRNELYAGTYSHMGTIDDVNLARWDGEQWYQVVGPITAVLCLTVYNDELYAGGVWFMTEAGDTAFGIARYYEPPDTVSCDFIRPYIHAMLYNTKDTRDTFYTTPPFNIQFYTNNKYASSWSWDFGDSGTANIREPEHTYSAPGTYNVTLEVIHPHNLSSVVCTLNVNKTITIIDNTAIKEIKHKEIEYLWQNIPNPYTQSTTIPYYLPAGTKTAYLRIHNKKGQLIDEYNLMQEQCSTSGYFTRQHCQIEISTANWGSGTYFYSIIIDGEVKQTKKMVGVG